MDYLLLMRDVVNEYKASIKRVDPTFDGDYYDRLVSGEPDTPAPEDSDEAPLVAVEQGVVQSTEPEQPSAPDQHPQTSTDQPTIVPPVAPTNS